MSEIEQVKTSSIMRDVLTAATLLLLVSATLPMLATPPATPSSGLMTRTQSPRPLAHLVDVDDFYRGELYTAFTEGQVHSATLLLLYAPWDASSSHLAKLVSGAKSVLSSSDIYLAGVNCWQHDGDCRRLFFDKRNNKNNNNLPILAIYPNQGSGLVYKGSCTMVGVISFVGHALAPLRVLRSIRDLQTNDFKSRVVFFGLNNLEWVSEVSLKMLEEDPHRHQIHSFNIVLNASLADELGLNRSVVKLVHWDDSHDLFVFDAKDGNRSSNLLKFVRNNNKPLITWASTSGRKSLGLSRLLRRNRYTLIAFVKRNDFDSIKGIKEVLAKYQSCSSFSSFSSSSDVLLQSCQRDEAIRAQFCRLEPNSCLCHENSSNKGSHDEYHEEVFRHNRTIGQNSPPFLLNCLSLMLQTKLCAKNSSSNESNEVFDAKVIEGLGCSSNKTVQFVFFDWDQDKALASNLGVKTQDEYKPAVIIVDWNNRIVFELNKVFTKVNFAHFLRDFHHNASSLPRLRRESSPTPPTKFGQEAFKERIDSNRTSVETLNTSSLLHFLSSSSSQHLLLLYTSPSCVFCSTISHTFLSLQLLIDDLKQKHVLKLARIDSSANDLPWQWSELALPSMLFVPGQRREETRAFPEHLEMSLANLIGFVMANLDEKDRKGFVDALCDHDCRKARRWRQTRALFAPSPSQVSTSNALLDQDQSQIIRPESSLGTRSGINEHSSVIHNEL